jgi:hypothetical protein
MDGEKPSLFHYIPPLGGGGGAPTYRGVSCKGWGGGEAIRVGDEDNGTRTYSWDPEMWIRNTDQMDFYIMTKKLLERKVVSELYVMTSYRYTMNLAIYFVGNRILASK